MGFRDQFELGVTEFNDGRFFECHDTFEEMWMEERGEHRRFLQGLIQASVGIFHATRGNFIGSESQITKSLTKLEEYPELYLGIEVVALRQGLQAFREYFRQMMREGRQPQYNPDLIPRIGYQFDPVAMRDLD
jgi:predicted metal-dependent hydrolase